MSQKNECDEIFHGYQSPALPNEEETLMRLLGEQKRLNTSGKMISSKEGWLSWALLAAAAIIVFSVWQFQQKDDPKHSSRHSNIIVNNDKKNSPSLHPAAKKDEEIMKPEDYLSDLMGDDKSKWEKAAQELAKLKPEDAEKIVGVTAGLQSTSAEQRSRLQDVLFETRGWRDLEEITGPYYVLVNMGPEYLIRDDKGARLTLNYDKNVKIDFEKYMIFVVVPPKKLQIPYCKGVEIVEDEKKIRIGYDFQDVAGCGLTLPIETARAFVLKQSDFDVVGPQIVALPESQAPSSESE